MEDHHEAIIPKELFLQVQDEIARRASERDIEGKRKGFSANHAFSQIVFCAECGGQYRRIHWNNRGKKSIVWRCLTRLKNKDKCRARTVKEEVLQEAFLDALNEMLANSNDYLNRLTANLEVAIKHNSTDEKLAEKMKVLQQDLLDRTERRENYDDVATEILRIRELQEQSNMDSVTKAEHKKRIQELQRFIKSQPTAVTKFDESLAKNLLSQIIIHDDFLEFKFKSGVTVSIEK
ncbi:recombinase zinc beta ribbon domain-containing protein [Ruminococcus callidus]|uniref:recombinase zinc beta ribbon domain-containing protein n=1 Tax=Ruminococcus callidus TaxID=40519 RepID=UPI0030B88A97